MGGILSQEEIDALFETTGSETLDSDQPAASSSISQHNAAASAAPAVSAAPRISLGPSLPRSNRTHFFLYCHVCGMTRSTFVTAEGGLVCPYDHKIRGL